MAYCFAWDQNVMGKWGCNATTLTCDGQNEKCPFFKTMEQHRADQKKAFEHIAKLPEWQQVSIADRHYGGEMPWRTHTEKHENKLSDVMGVV